VTRDKIAIEIRLNQAHLFTAERIMSRNLVILLVVLSAGIAGLIVFSKLRSPTDSRLASNQPGEAPVPTVPPRAPSGGPAGKTPVAQTNQPTVTGRVATIPPLPPGTTPLLQLAPAIPTATNDEPALETKPLPVLEKEYTTTTNRDTRLDLMMDIAETPSADAVKALTRLFEVETDPDLKVDLIDSLLGIEGFKDEKLIMLTMGARQGLPSDVRQSAIDGLIDLDDQRVIPVLNGLLNDPDEEIRESAKDAIEMLQSEPPVLIK
jgi:hypothetical protein